MGTTFPACSAEWVSAEWVSAVLGAEVDDFSLVDIGVGTGVFGEIGRPEPSAPASLVAKFPATREANLAVGLALRLYEREVRFSTEIEPALPVRVPRCSGACMDLERGAALTAAFVEQSFYRIVNCAAAVLP